MSNRYYDRYAEWDDRDIDLSDRSRRRADAERDQGFGRSVDYEDRGRYGRGYGRETGFADRNNRGYGDRYDNEPYSGGARYGRTYGSEGRRSARDYGYQGPFGGYGATSPRERYTERYSERDYRNEERGWFDRASDEVSSWFGDEDAERRRMMDERRDRGSHAGRGPKGYKRSDERIREDVCDRLADHPYLDASDIEVAVAEGVVTLTGTARDRRTKRLAEDVIENVSGVQDVHNQVRVNRPSTSAPTSTSAQSPAATPADKGTKH